MLKQDVLSPSVISNFVTPWTAACLHGRQFLYQLSYEGIPTVRLKEINYATCLQ